MTGIFRVAVLVAVILSLSACETIDDPAADQTKATSNTALAPERIEPTIQLAEKAIKEGRYDDAQRLLERVLINQPQNLHAQLDMAELTFARGQFEPAQGMFEGLTVSPEIAAKAYQGMGLAMMLSDDQEGGYKALTTATDLDGSLWRAWNGLGYYYDLQADWVSAEGAYAKALLENPNSAFVYNNLGYSLIMQGRYQDAIESLSQALKLDPELATAQTNMRLALAWRGKYALATTGVTDTDKGKVYNNIGFVALMRRDYANAETYLLRAMEEDPTFNQTARKNLALLRNLQEIEKNEEVGEALPEALLPNPVPVNTAQ